jgi:hypothetical protein
MAIPVSDSNRRRRSTLAEWVSFGHNESELRRLAKLDALPLAPVSETKRTR